MYFYNDGRGAADAELATLDDLKGHARADLGTLPAWLEELDDPGVYLGVEEDAPDGRVVEIEGNGLAVPATDRSTP